MARKVEFMLVYDENKNHELSLEEWKDYMWYTQPGFESFVEIDDGRKIVGAYCKMDKKAFKEFMRRENFKVDQVKKGIKFLSGSISQETLKFYDFCQMMRSNESLKLG